MNISRRLTVLIILSFIALTYFKNAVLCELTNRYVATLLGHIIGIVPATSGNILFMKMDDYIVPILISFECTGLMFISIFLLTMFILPDIRLKHRLLSLLLLPMLYLANLARIIIGISLGAYTEDTHLMTLFHDTLGQVVLVIFTIVTLLVFLGTFGYIKLKRGL
ncbi:hypothetical protein [Methanomethylovorans sp.]|uniref:hypothetical protein n=1 Tax=Methanomethylovorans sp. TaxID=2758717 RepID=UPI00351BEFDF